MEASLTGKVCFPRIYFEKYYFGSEQSYIQMGFSINMAMQQKSPLCTIFVLKACHNTQFVNLSSSAGEQRGHPDRRPP